MTLINSIWWFVFILFAIIGQMLFSGLDFLIIGFIILLQEQDLKQFLIISPFLFFLHESISTFSFSSTILWYVATFALLIIARFIFEVENFLFMFLFSSALSFAQVGLLGFMAQLQGIDYHMNYVLDLSVLQALSMPVIWYALKFIRPRFEEPVAL